MEECTLRPIAHIQSAFAEKFGIPRQSGLVESLPAQVIFEPEFRSAEALRGLEEYSHIWLIWHFSANRPVPASPTVRPPRLGGNTRMGVFATRSPYRPNPLGLSCVRLTSIELSTPQGPVLHVAGADLMDKTPIFDIKPYLPHIDSKPDALGGFSSRTKAYALSVDFPPQLLLRVPAPLRKPLCEVLAQDPRPSYQNDPSRVYGFAFAEQEIHFTVSDGCVHVCGVSERGEKHK
ncbi:MAG TPA: tRNA (N6-threonylcarbamoyladenosine(37)-N6)-methyltransferase TrmO [Candidatus Ruthenibacterium merdigallinarum]|nr:tRNA (N6-threonylcarbamoyladenosine(37)-N6)-methyltransferase TrmO [Candidatus Ruthenibacterium merdigallinarum]